MAEEITIHMTDYMKHYDAVWDKDDKIKYKDRYSFFKQFFGGFKDIKAYGCSKGDVTLDKPLLNDDDSLNKDLVEDKNTYIWIKGLVGTLHNSEFGFNGKKYDVTLEINSRFDNRDKPYFLYTMLSEALIGVNETPSESNKVKLGRDTSTPMTLKEVLLVMLFRSYVIQAYESSGIYRAYVMHEYNDEKLRGRIDIARHIRLNIGRNDARIAYSVNERTENNSLNRLAVYTWEYLKRECPSAVDMLDAADTDAQATFNKAMREMTDFVGGAAGDRIRCIAENQRPIASPFYERYEQLRLLCLEILKEEANDTVYNKNNEASGVLFYVPDLWERFLELRMRQKLKDSITMKAQDECKYYIGHTVVRPDYVFYKDKEPLFILDAKFKEFNGWYNSDDGKIYLPWQYKPSNADDLDKLIRDMFCFGVKSGGLIYPCETYSDMEYTRYGNSLSEIEALFDYSGDRKPYKRFDKNKNEEYIYKYEYFKDVKGGKLKAHIEPQKYGSFKAGIRYEKEEIEDYKKNVGNSVLITERSGGSFYYFPVEINNPGDNYDEWRKAFDDSVNDTLKKLKDVLDPPDKKTDT